MFSSVDDDLQEILDQNRLVFLNDNNRERLKKIQDKATGIWGGASYQEYYTLHDHRHSAKVEFYLGELLLHAMGNKNRKDNPINEFGLFCLLASCWIHDLGMCQEYANRDNSYEIIRDAHNIVSAELIEKDYGKWGLKRNEGYLISTISKLHRKREPIEGAKWIDRSKANPRLLAAYFRLADALHVDDSRTPDDLYELFLHFNMPWDSRLHWLKCKSVTEVTVDHDNREIKIGIVCPSGDTLYKEAFAKFIRDEVLEELYTVKDILIRGGISFFLDVTTYIEEKRFTKEENEFRKLVGDLVLQTRASATDLAERAYETILQLSVRNDSKRALIMIKEYNKEVIERLSKDRPCHILLKRINSIINKVLEKEVKGDKSRKTQLKELSSMLKKQHDLRSKGLQHLYQNSEGFLIDGEPILLFGYSRLVVGVLIHLLKNADGNKNTIRDMPIYICECAPKSRYDYKNDIDYSDGISYAKAIKSIGFNNVYIVPDIVVANLMIRGCVKKVLFGANGVDPFNGIFGHSAGHLAISDLARAYDIPVYVIADTWKFGQIKPDYEMPRKRAWLTGAKIYKELPPKLLVKIENPREDCVEIGKKKTELGMKIYMLVTEEGVFPPNKIPQRILDNTRSKLKELKLWVDPI